MALAGEEMAEGEFAHLLGGHIGKLVLTPAQRRGPQPRHRFDVILATFVIDAHALAALEDERTGFAQLHEIGVGVQEDWRRASGNWSGAWGTLVALLVLI